MTDIVERLRNTIVWDDGGSESELIAMLNEAADEIEQLNARCKTLENTAMVNLAGYKRLRAALADSVVLLSNHVQMAITDSSSTEKP